MKCFKQVGRRKEFAFTSKATSAAVLMFSAWVVGAQELPSVKLLTAPLVSPDAAWQHYDSLPNSTVHTNGVAWKSTRPAEIQELTRALGAGRYSASEYAKNVFEYVRNNIEIDFRFGLSKGARGAIIDQSGTAFDQAHLMVELLREGNVAAGYQIGTVTLNGTQFYDWTGFTSAARACQFLADGGIPATVNGSTSCSSLSGSVTSVVMGHIWVSANSTLYDPAYKKHVIKSGIDLAAAMGCGSASSSTCGAGVKNNVPTPVTQGNGVRYIPGAGLSAAIGSQLRSYGTALENWIQGYNSTNKTVMRIEELVGGQTVDLDAPLTIGSGPPYQATTRYQIGHPNDIPDIFRTTLRVKLDDINVLVYADEVAGGRLRIWGLPYNPSWGVTGRTLALYFEYRPLAKSTRVLGNLDPVISTTVTHPYVLAFANDTLNQEVSPESSYYYHTSSPPPSTAIGTVGIITVIHGFGEASPTTVSHYGALQQRDMTSITPEEPSNPNHIWLVRDFEASGGYACTWPNLPVPNGSVADTGCYAHHQSVLAANFLSQASAVRGLIGGVNGGRVQHHHSVGYVMTPAVDFFRSTDYINVQSSLSASAKSIDATTASGDRSSMFSAATTVMSRLEGSIFEQTNNAFEGGSTPSLFARSSDQGMTFFEVTQANYANTMYSLGNYSQKKRDTIWQYVGSNAYSVIAPSGDSLAMPTGTAPIALPIGMSTAVRNGYAAYGSSGDRIAFIVRDSDKGAVGGGAQDPAAAALESVKLQDQSAKKKSYYGVNPVNSSLKLSPPPDLVTGSGSFPSSLPFQRFYNSADKLEAVYAHRSPCAANDWACGNYSSNGYNGWAGWMGGVYQSNSNPPVAQSLPFGGGWKSNFSISARIASDAFASLGRDSAFNAAGVVSAIYTLRDLNKDTQDFTSRLSSILTGAWSGTLLSENTVIVERPPNTATFVRRLDGTNFAPPVGSTERLVQGGGRILSAIYSGDWWDYSPIVFYLTESDGSEMFFRWRSQFDQYKAENFFVPEYWNFPDGRSLKFTYGHFTYIPPGWGSLGSSPSPCLTRVENNLGRALTFECRQEGVSWVRDETNREVKIRTVDDYASVYQLSTNANYANWVWPKSFIVTAPDGVSETRYDYSQLTNVAVERSNGVIEKVYTPDDKVNPFFVVNYDSLLRVKEIVDKSGVSAKFFSSGLYSGQYLVRADSQDGVGATSTEKFDKAGSQIELVDALGRLTNKRYDNVNRLTRITYSEGNSVEYTYDARSNRLTEQLRVKPGSGLSDPPPVVTTYKEGPTVFECADRKTCNKPAWTEDAKGHRTTYTYRSNGQLESATGPAVTNGVTGNSYALYGYTPYAGIGSLGGSISMLSSITQRVDNSRNRVSTFTYNPSNKLVLDTATVDPSGFSLQTKFTFDAVGNVRTIDGPRPGTADTSTYWFDKLRRLTRADAPLNSYTRYAYYADGTLRTTSNSLVTSPTDADPTNSFAVFDTDPECSSNPATCLVASQWNTEKRAYFPTGELQWVKDPEGNTTSYVYDPVGRTTIVTDPDGRRVATVYNLAGETMCSFKAWNSTTPPTTSDCNSWNPASYTLQTSPLRYAAYTYTDNGKQRSVKDANNNETRYQYDGLDRLAYSFFPDPDSGSLCSDAPAGGLPACAGRATYEQYGYDNNGNRTSLRTRKGETVTTTYDAMNRVWTKQAQGQAQVTYGYNLSAEPTSLSDGAHSIGYDYDSAGRKSYESNDGRQVSYLYDEAGNRTRTTWPDGYYVRYQYDVLNRMEYVWDHNNTELAHYEYDELSRREFLTYGNNANNKIAYTYETDSNLRTLQHIMNLGVNFTYDHNRSGQITGIDATDGFYLTQPSATGTTGYMVNKLNQYVGVGPQTGTDANGNPIVASAPSSKKWVTIPIDDLSIVIPVKGKVGSTPEVNQPDPGGDSLVHDLNGNLVRWSSTKGRALYTYDSENRLRTTAFDGSTVAGISYEYDPLGRRISKTVNGTMTRYLLDGDEEVAEYDASWSLLRRYITGPAIDDRIAMQSGGAYSYYRTNHQGSVIALTDSGGTAGDRYAYDEYGNLTAGSASGQPFRYTGRRFDEETGLYYYRARYYSPTLGRFLQTDPIGYKDDLNLYAYVGNNPVNATDPDGQIAFLIPLAIIAYRAYSAYDTVSSTIENAKTITSDTASTTDKVLAVVDTVSNIGCGKVCGKASDALKAVVKKADDAGDAVEATAKSTKELRGKEFKERVWEKNTKEHGTGTCEKCGKEDLEKGKKLNKGDKVSENRGDADHVDELADGGADNADTNGQLLCNPCHKDKTKQKAQERAERKRLERMKGKPDDVDY